MLTPSQSLTAIPGDFSKLKFLFHKEIVSSPKQPSSFHRHEDGCANRQHQP